MALWFSYGNDHQCHKGIHVLVPRNMTKAAGFYNSLLECDEPALVIECLMDIA
jgi:hypothetical protein